MNEQQNNNIEELEYYKTLVEKQRLASRKWKIAHPEKQKNHMKNYYETKIKGNDEKRLKQLEANKRYYYKKRELLKEPLVEKLEQKQLKIVEIPNSKLLGAV
jgi:hypothetical protein